MSLRCGLGYHTASGVPRWNDGHYFARCERCGIDLVRTPFSRWHVPEGYRVVWQALPPASRPDVKLEPELELEPTEPVAVPVAGAAAPPAEAAAPTADTADNPEIALPAEEPATVEQKRRGLPVEALLERLRGTAGPGAAPPEAPAPAAPAPPPDWDFMMEPEERARPANRQVATSFKPAPAPLEAPGTAAAVESGQARLGPSMLSRAFVILRRRAASTYRRARRNKRVAQVAFAALIGAVAVAGFLSLPKRPASEIPEQVMPAVQPQEISTVAAQTEPSFVSARFLSCRDAPALQARRVRVLARGAAVQVLARDGEWVSLATSVGQCWAIGRYVSEPRPL